MTVNNKAKGLGKGLSALFDNNDILTSVKKGNNPSVKEVAIEDIMPNDGQPRKYFEKAVIEELAESIKSLGLIQPITVREDGGKYVIISGERRYRASVEAGLKTMPVYIRKVNDTEMLEMALVENVQREDLNAIEIASTLDRLIEECGITQENLAKRIGKKRSTISNYIRLLKLPPEVQLALQKNLLTMGHARALLSLEDPKTIISLCDRIIRDGLSVRQVEMTVHNMLTKDNKAKPRVELPQHYTRLASRMKAFMNSDVDIKRSADGKTKIVISVENDDRLTDLINKFENI